MMSPLRLLVAFLVVVAAGSAAHASPAPSGYVLLAFTDGGADGDFLRAAMPGVLLVERPRLGIDDRPRRGAANVLSEPAGGARPRVNTPQDADGSIFFQPTGNLLGEFPLPGDIAKKP